MTALAAMFVDREHRPAGCKHLGCLALQGLCRARHAQGCIASAFCKVVPILPLRKAEKPAYNGPRQSWVEIVIGREKGWRVPGTKMATWTIMGRGTRDKERR